MDVYNKKRLVSFGKGLVGAAAIILFVAALLCAISASVIAGMWYLAIPVCIAVLASAPTFLSVIKKLWS